MKLCKKLKKSIQCRSNMEPFNLDASWVLAQNLSHIYETSSSFCHSKVHDGEFWQVYFPLQHLHSLVPFLRWIPLFERFPLFRAWKPVALISARKSWYTASLLWCFQSNGALIVFLISYNTSEYLSHRYHTRSCDFMYVMWHVNAEKSVSIAVLQHYHFSWKPNNFLAINGSLVEILSNFSLNGKAPVVVR